MEKKGKKNVVLPRTFASPAYLRPEGDGLFRLYRDVLVEVIERGKVVREKTGKSICVSPFFLRELRDGDDERQVVVRSNHPDDGRPLNLVEVRE